MATIIHSDPVHGELSRPAEDALAPSADERMLARADLAFELVRVGFDGPLFLSYAVWPAPLCDRR